MKTLACLPHLVLVPGTLLGQWDAEIRSWFQPKRVDILLYKAGKGAGQSFWGEDGLYSQSKHMPSQQIIVTSHSVGPYLLSSCVLWLTFDRHFSKIFNSALVQSHPRHRGVTLHSHGEAIPGSLANLLTRSGKPSLDSNTYQWPSMKDIYLEMSGLNIVQHY